RSPWLAACDARGVVDDELQLEASRALATFGRPVERQPSRACAFEGFETHRPAAVDAGDDAATLELRRSCDAAGEPVRQVADRYAPAEHAFGQRLARLRTVLSTVGGDERRFAGLERDLRHRLPERRRELELASRSIGEQRETPARALLARLVPAFGVGDRETAAPEIRLACGVGGNRRRG